MKKFHLIGEKTTQAFTEAHLVRSGYILAGTVGLVESIQAFKSRGFDVVVDDPATDPYVLTEASALTEGFFDAVKEKLASALQKVKSGEISKDAFDKYYDELKSEGKMSYGKGTFTDRVGGDSTQVNPAAGLGARSGSGISATSSSPRKVFADKPAAPKDDQTISKEEVDKKIRNYKNLFKADLAKYKKLFELDPAAIDEFKAMLDTMTAKRDEQFAALSEAEEAKPEVDVKPEPEAEPKPEVEPKEEPTKPSRFGFKFKNSMMVFEGKPEVGAKVKVIKVDNNTNLKPGDEGEITKPVEEGKPLYVKLTSGEHAGKVYHTDALSKLKTA